MPTVADRGDDVCVEPELALLHRPRLLAALGAVFEVLLAEHPNGTRRPDVRAYRRWLLGGGASQHTLPRLALGGGRTELDLVLVAA